ncbi:MAG: hypothetical protein JWP63_5115, partial [Candidatus Solibacter sp.]|nr:hypothetical protein [Candidatus Solibacter sp.]
MYASTQSKPPAIPRHFSFRLRVSRWFAILVLIAFAIPVAVRFAGYAVRSTYRHELAYNEGWNVFYAHSAAAGNLYRAPPSRLAANYPNVSFHLVAAVGSFVGNLNFAGRLVSMAALFWLAICAAFIVNR